ncbi:MAG TPA: branched-chain amino acid ABC transporter permease [Beijerinckiaceae bacterium]|jgi:branched-chain amino acid transport system permease protein|nr:branched-chain amino acid ABC transporter permease [Beijerinckiaceae bacterium]
MDYLVSSLTFIAIYGVSYGMVIFLISIGLVITMGLMRVINLAHGAFAAIGGYLCTALVSSYKLNFYLAVVVATLSVALLSLVVERGIYRQIYRKSELDQVLLTIGLAFITVASLNFLFGPNVVPSQLPADLSGTVELLGRDVQMYRLFVVAVGLVVVVALWALFNWTMFGASLRAAVDNPSMAQAAGIDVSRLFTLAFALGSGLAALGGAVGYGMLPLEPLYPFKYLIIIMIVVALSGFGNMRSAAAVSIAVGVVDTAGRYFFPTYGAFIIYVFVILYLLAQIEGSPLRRKS